MNRRMMDYMDRRDYRDYDRRYDRDMNRDYGEDYDEYDRRDGRNPYGSRGGYVSSRRPGRGDRAYEYEGTFRGGDHRMYPDYGRKLESRELEEWEDKLMSHVGDSSKDMLKEDQVMKKAKEHNIKMEKYTPDEFYVTVLMLYTDYWKTVGRGNIDMIVKLAEDFLCDNDAAVQGSEKLAAYYDAIVADV